MSVSLDKPAVVHRPVGGFTPDWYSTWLREIADRIDASGGMTVDDLAGLAMVIDSHVADRVPYGKRSTGAYLVELRGLL